VAEKKIFSPLQRGHEAGTPGLGSVGALALLRVGQLEAAVVKRRRR
jgi:hypothetical protein